MCLKKIGLVHAKSWKAASNGSSTTRINYFALIPTYGQVGGITAKFTDFSFKKLGINLQVTFLKKIFICHL